MQDWYRLLETINELKSDMLGKDFLLSWEKSKDELQQILLIAHALFEMRRLGYSPRLYSSGLAVSHFRDNSTRTRFAFAAAANLLGLSIQDLDEERSQISHGETVQETAVMISFLSEVIGIRDDIYLGAGNAYMRAMGEALDGACREGVLQQRPTILNLQCDLDHPTQTLADLLHLRLEFGSLENLQGRKLGISWAYSPSYGKPLSVPQGLLALLPRFGMEVVLAHPQGYELHPQVRAQAEQLAKTGGGSIRYSNNMEDAFQDAAIVYPKSWAPYAIMEERTSLLTQQDAAGLAALEKRCLEENARYRDWECTEKLLRQSDDALYLHCLPADISGVSCEQGEVAADVFQRFRPKLYRQAGYKPYVIAAMIVASRFPEPGRLLARLELESERRIHSG